jgi:hypothetical protein
METSCIKLISYLSLYAFVFLSVSDNVSDSKKNIGCDMPKWDLQYPSVSDPFCKKHGTIS